MTKYIVVIEEDAEHDLDDIVDYIAAHASIDRAISVATRIEQSIAHLATFPSRGTHPKELLEYGNREFREVHFKPYRIIYRVLRNHVFVVLIADGRRDMRTLLTRRLLGA